MEITLDSRYNAYTIKVESGDAVITSDVTHIEFIREEENGKAVRTTHYREPNNEIINNLQSVLEDLVYNRVNDVDSSYLIGVLFSKLPQDKVQDLLNTLNEDYGNE